jgi:hypothetical protein
MVFMVLTVHSDRLAEEEPTAQHTSGLVFVDQSLYGTTYSI